MKEGVNGVHSCDDCERVEKTLCDKCRLVRCQESNDECKSCTKMVSSLILEQSKKFQDEISSLKKEVKDLKKEVKDMKDNISMATFLLNHGRSL